MATEEEQIKIQMDKGEAPPTYTQASNNDSPPSYDSIFGKFKEAKAESNGNVDLAQRVTTIVCCGTICSIISFVILFSIPIANVVIGSLYLDKCKVEKYIPIFLLVAGVFGIVKGFLQVGLFIKNKNSDEDKDEAKKAKPNPIDQILNCFLFAWFIAGSVWVYSNYQPEFDNKDAKDYCHETCYMYAFWFLTISYIILGLSILCCCFGMIAFCCMAAKGGD